VTEAVRCRQVTHAVVAPVNGCLREVAKDSRQLRAKLLPAKVRADVVQGANSSRCRHPVVLVEVPVGRAVQAAQCLLVEVPEGRVALRIPTNLDSVEVPAGREVQEVRVVALFRLMVDLCLLATDKCLRAAGRLRLRSQTART